MSSDVWQSIAIVLLAAFAVWQVLVNINLRRSLVHVLDLMLAIRLRQLDQLMAPIGPPVFCGHKTGERTWCAVKLVDGRCTQHGDRR